MLVSIHKLHAILLIIAQMGFLQLVAAQEWTLRQCIDTALVNNKNLQISSGKVLMADQKHKETGANLFPRVTANADYRYYFDLPYQLMPASVFGAPPGTFKEAQFGVPHNINANLQLIMPLYNPQIFGGIKTTKIATELNQLNHMKTEEQIYFEISNLYYNAQIMHHQLAFIDSNLINNTKLLANLELLREQLLARQSDVSKIHLQIDQLNTLRESVSNKYDQILNALKFTMGISVDRQIEVSAEIQYQENEDHQMSTILDIRLAETQNRLLLSELNTLKKTTYLPSVSLYATYGTMGYGYDQKPNDFLKFFPVSFAGVQLSYPLFNGTLNQRRIKQKKLEIDNSKLQISLVTEQNEMLWINARRQKLLAMKTIGNTMEQIKLAQIIYGHTVLQQKEGTASLSDVLTADVALRESQQANLSAIIDYLKADLELKKLTGNISSKAN